MKSEKSIQSRVRSVLKAYKHPIRKNEIRDLIGLAGAKGYARVNNAVQDLVKSGAVERVSYGRYQWVGQSPDSRYYKMQTNLWRFMWIRTKKGKSFSARDVSEVTGSAHYTAQKYIGFLFKSGFIEKVGRKRAFKTNAPLYMILPDKMNATVPLMKRQSGTAAIEKYLDEVRLLSASFFQIEDTKLETIQSLKNTNARIAALLNRCEVFAFSLSKKNKKS
ncbi:MAG: hypothetical protein C4522_02720 [Desulfobacteraceae bacterium]|nr:MAG: hypothetical protein C4522_02720 [Desulfobacteraceae bacterium]